MLTGAGDKAFCTGGDQTIRDNGGYGGAVAALPLEVGWQQVSLLIRTIPKPVIARVNGFAIGGGHVFQVVCDLSIASETAQFGQAGPRVGSFDPGYGTGDLARAVGMKKAKEIWYLCRRYTARQALEMGLVSAVVPRKTRRRGRELVPGAAGEEPHRSEDAQVRVPRRDGRCGGDLQPGESAVSAYYARRTSRWKARPPRGEESRTSPNSGAGEIPGCKNPRMRQIHFGPFKVSSLGLDVVHLCIKSLQGPR